jgi:hypothetical protein
LAHTAAAIAAALDDPRDAILTVRSMARPEAAATTHRNGQPALHPGKAYKSLQLSGNATT